MDKYRLQCERSTQCYYDAWNVAKRDHLDSLHTGAVDQGKKLEGKKSFCHFKHAGGSCVIGKVKTILDKNSRRF